MTELEKTILRVKNPEWQLEIAHCWMGDTENNGTEIAFYVNEVLKELGVGAKKDADKAELMSLEYGDKFDGEKEVLEDFWRATGSPSVGKEAGKKVQK